MVDASDEWTMADGQAPVSRLHYCQRPAACSAPRIGPCPRCQPRAMARRNFINRLGAPPVTVNSVAVCLDPEFDDMGD